MLRFAFSKAIACPQFSQDKTWGRRVVFDFGAQLADEDAQILSVIPVSMSQDFGDELYVGQKTPCIAGEDREQIVLLGRKLNCDAMPCHQPLSQVNNKGAALDSLDLSGIARGVTISGPQTRHQFANREGLFDIIVGAGIERHDLFCLAIARGEHDDRSFREGASLRDDLLAINVWQSKIEQDDIWRASSDGAQSFFSVHRRQYLKAAGCQCRS